MTNDGDNSDGLPKGRPIPKYSLEKENDIQSKSQSEAVQKLAESDGDDIAADLAWSPPDAEVTGDAPNVTLPAGTFHPVFNEWLEPTAHAMKTSPLAVAAALLGTSGAAIGNARVATAGPGTWFLAILWIMLVGTSGAAKTPAIRSAVRHYAKLEKRLLGAHSDNRELTPQEREDITAACAERLRILSAKTAIGGRENVEEHLEEDQPFARFIVHDGSIPGLEKIVGGNVKGAVFVQQELSELFDENGKIIQTMISAHDGEDYFRVLATKDVAIPNFTLGVMGGIQPDVLKKYFPKFRNDGLLARFLPVVFQRVKRAPFHGEIDDTPIYDALAWLRALQMEPGEFGPEARVVWFTPEARVAYGDGVARLEDLAESATGLMQSFLFKGCVTIGRLALVLTYMDAAVGSHEEPGAIEADAVRRATHLFENVFVPMAREAFFEDSAPRYKKDARTIVSIIRQLGVTRVTVRDIQRHGGDKFRKAEDVEHGFAELEDKDVLRYDKGTTGPRGGRPSHGYLVNPHILRRAPEVGGD